MKIDVVTLFPDECSGLTSFGITGRAVEAGIVRLAFWNPRDHADDRRGTVDDRPFGGGPGMVMKVEPLRTCLQAVRSAEAEPGLVVALSPQGRRMDDATARWLAGQPRLILVCGRYEGFDERLLESAVDMELSVGDFVLSGGELGAAIVIDSVARLQPGALGRDESAEQDSFAAGLLDCPHYTRPEEIEGRAVPDVLRSGDHGRIERWRLKQALARTWRRRPDLLARRRLTLAEQRLLGEYIAEFMTEPDGPVTVGKGLEP
ncbi:MAG: tRNA (guanosine(37)-N1)-methyltransferase TrmD [Xanthomonadales bacterium]|nr:tRNA (guanosine(37)-N1)-methyltransferase TrmD [Xanthomonadales bacterium]